MLMHNSGRPTDGSVRASGVKSGNVLVGHRGGVHAPCEASGKIVFSDLTDSWGGEPASKSSLDDPYRMKALDTFHPFIDTPETADPAPGARRTTSRSRVRCSAPAGTARACACVDITTRVTCARSATTA